MVLSNKKLKQKLRAVKTALLADSEVQIRNHEGSNNSTNPEKPTFSTAQESLKSLLDSVAQKPRLSKREKLRKKSLLLQESGEILKIDSGAGNQGKKEIESQTRVEDNKKIKKRKRGDENGLEKVTEKKKKAKKKKKQKNKKGKKKLENTQVKENLEIGNAEGINQGLNQTAIFGERYVNKTLILFPES